MHTVFRGVGLAMIIPVTASASEDPASLDHLVDILSLPPVSWWPLAPGWYVVTAAVLVLLGVLVIKVWLHRRRNHYRVLALSEIKHAGKGATAVAHIAQVLKRTALAVAPRQNVAALSGEQWLQWLNQNGNGVSFSEKSRQILSENIYGAGQADDADIEALARTAQAWINKHKVASISVSDGSK